MKDQLIQQTARVRELTELISDLEYKLSVAKTERTEILENQLPLVMRTIGVENMSFKNGDDTYRLDLTQEVTASVSYENGQAAAPILTRIMGAPVAWAYSLNTDDPDVISNLTGVWGGKAKPDLAWQTLRKHVRDALLRGDLSDEEQTLLKVQVREVVTLKG